MSDKSDLFIRKLQLDSKYGYTPRKVTKTEEGPHTLFSLESLED